MPQVHPMFWLTFTPKSADTSIYESRFICVGQKDKVGIFRETSCYDQKSFQFRRGSVYFFGEDNREALVNYWFEMGISKK